MLEGPPIADKAKEASFRAQYPFNNGLVTVEVNPAHLREDVIIEAVGRGIDEAKARTSIEDVSFSFDGRKGWAGEVGIDDQGKKLCNFKPEILVGVMDRKFLKKRKLGPTLLVSKGDSKETALERAFSTTWTHEREHLIQIIEGKYEKKRQERDKRYKILKGSVVATIIPAGVTMLYGVATSAESFKTFYVGVGSLLLSTALAIVAKVYPYRYSAIEREAYAIQYPTAKTPFKLTFQKSEAN